MHTESRPRTWIASMTIHRPCVTAFALASTMLVAGPRAAAAQAPSPQPPTQVAATLGNSPRRYNGTYTASQVSRVCGELDPALSFGPRAFVVEFPLDYDGVSEIKDVRFTSKALVGPVKETGAFFVSISVKSQVGGEPPAYVVNTERAGSSAGGTASLDVSRGVTRLTVKAVDELNQTLDMTIVCLAPKPDR